MLQWNALIVIKFMKKIFYKTFKFNEVKAKRLIQK